MGGRELLVLTHAHLEHVGSAHELSQRSAHELEPTGAHGQGTLSRPRLAEILGAEDAGLDTPGERLVSALPHAGYDEADRTLFTGDVDQVHAGHDASLDGHRLHELAEQHLQDVAGRTPPG